MAIKGFKIDLMELSVLFGATYKQFVITEAGKLIFADDFLFYMDVCKL